MRVELVSLRSGQARTEVGRNRCSILLPAQQIYFKNILGAICGRLSILHNLPISKVDAGYYYQFMFFLLFVTEQHIISHFRV